MLVFPYEHLAKLLARTKLTFLHQGDLTAATKSYVNLCYSFTPNLKPSYLQFLCLNSGLEEDFQPITKRQQGDN